MKTAISSIFHGLDEKGCHLFPKSFLTVSEESIFFVCEAIENLCQGRK